MIITRSPDVQKLIRLAKRVAGSNAPVLISGESGTGKELFAKLIHDTSPRNGRPFVRVNCAALPGSLVESELFGHEKGSFTDAVTQRIGRFEQADHGTLFLDEIGELPIVTQPKLLRVLESQEFERVGNSVPIRHDARIVAASNRDLEKEIQAGQFRLDLYHRVGVIPIHIPPLRERTEDIPLLAEHFFKQHRSKCNETLQGFTESAMSMLARHSWPGNVRELRNVIQRSCVLCEQPWIDATDIELQHQSGEIVNQAIPHRWLETPLATTEREIIVAALDKYKNQQVVAAKLAISTRTLTNKLRRYREETLSVARAA